MPKYFADEIEYTQGDYSKTPAVQAYTGTQKLTRAEFVELCALIGQTNAWFRVHHDCFGHGNTGVANMHTVIFNEYASTEGVVHGNYMHTFETNDKGQLTKIAFYEYGRKPLPDQVTTFTSRDENAECDTSNEEVVLQLPGKVSSLEKCQSLCTNEPKCNSITYFQSGYCSLFSTYCNNYKFKSKAISQYKLAVPKNLADLGRIEVKREFETVGVNNECAIKLGEVFLNTSPGADTSFDECKKSCKDNGACNSLTFFYASGYCSHFSTACDKVNTFKSKKTKAISLRLVSPPQLFPWSAKKSLRRS